MRADGGYFLGFFFFGAPALGLSGSWVGLGVGIWASTVGRQSVRAFWSWAVFSGFEEARLVVSDSSSARL